MNDEERAALREAMRLDYPAFPCLGDKRPACPTGFKAAAPAWRGLATLWMRHPGTLVGVPAGELSGRDILDVDRGKRGEKWWAENRHRIPPTRKHRTRSGGLHVLFKHRAGLKPSVGRIAPGIDVRAQGSYIIWWPAAGFPVQDHPLADWPDWLMPTDPTPSPRPRPREGGPASGAEEDTMRALRGAAQLVERAAKGERNAICFWAACRAAEKLRDGPLPSFVTADWITELLACAASRAGLPAREAGLTIASGLRRA